MAFNISRDISTGELTVRFVEWAFDPIQADGNMATLMIDQISKFLVREYIEKHRDQILASIHPSTIAGMLEPAIVELLAKQITQKETKNEGI